MQAKDAAIALVESAVLLFKCTVLVFESAMLGVPVELAVLVFMVWILPVTTGMQQMI